MTKEQIEKINKTCPYEQGIFTTPYGLEKIKEPVIYMKWNSGGLRGGGCWGGEPESYTEETPEFEVLDLVLTMLCHNITYLQYKGIEKLIVSTEEEDWQYYGNMTEWGIKYIILSELEDYIEKLKTPSVTEN